jgi:hypothetical protein
VFLLWLPEQLTAGQDPELQKASVFAGAFFFSHTRSDFLLICGTRQQPVAAAQRKPSAASLTHSRQSVRTRFSAHVNNFLMFLKEKERRRNVV